MRTFSKYLLILPIYILGLMYSFNYLNEFPSYIHAWAQSDRYAISLGFIENDFNFFEPQTFVLNHQFPDEWKKPSNNTITAVDFPVHDYMVAIIMKLLGNDSVLLYRCYSLFYSFLGLFFLFKLSYSISRSKLKSLVIMIFAVTSPVFVYYQSGFLPTIPSLANTLIGVYFYFEYLNNLRKRHFILAIFFLTIAALSRMTFAIPLIAVGCFEFLNYLKSKASIRFKILPYALSFATIIAYALYNRCLRERYGSIFLNHFMPASSIGQVLDILSSVYENWSLDYFSFYHYLFLLVVIVVYAYLSLNKRLRYIKNHFLVYTSIVLLGCVLFSGLMLKQFTAHDYYFLDTFYLPIILLVIALISRIDTNHLKLFKHPFLLVISFLLIMMIAKPLDSQKSRRITGDWDRTSAMIRNYSSGAQLLDSLNIGDNAKILVFDANAPNIPFILMKRNGYVVLNTTRENIQEALAWDFDYIMYQKAYFMSDIYSEVPEVINRFEIIAENAEVTLCKYNTSIKERSLLQYLFQNKTPVIEIKHGFENEHLYDTWQNLQKDSTNVSSGSYSGIMKTDQVYGITYKTKDFNHLKTGKRELIFTADFFQPELLDCELVVTITEQGENVYYKTYNLKNHNNLAGKWNGLSFLFRLPMVKADEYEFAAYLWNTGEGQVQYDDLELMLY